MPSADQARKSDLSKHEIYLGWNTTAKADPIPTLANPTEPIPPAALN